MNTGEPQEECGWEGDCFHCPYEDCIASDRKILAKDKKERAARENAARKKEGQNGEN